MIDESGRFQPGWIGFDFKWRWFELVE